MPSVETVSVMFTDMVDSTATLLALPAAEAEEVRAAIYALQRASVANGGGTEVKSTGDGVMVVFPNVGAALATATAIQQAFERHNRRASIPILLRIGINVGDAVFDGDDYYGEAVVEAARLCAAAAPAQILTTEIVRMLAGANSPHGFETVGPMVLKGLPAPVNTVAVRWERQLRAPVPLPSRFATSPALSFVGRAAERAALEQALAVAHGGDSATVFLAGEPGIGKTRLAAELARSASAEGAIVLLGRCDEDVGGPFAPFVEAFDHLVAHAPASVLASYAAASGGELCRIVPRLADRWPDLAAARSSDPETERFLLYRASAQLLAAAASEHAVVLVIDDVHWADRQSLSLLRFLATERVPGLLLLSTFRSSEVDDAHPLQVVLAQLHRQVQPVRLDLAGLGEPELVEMLEAVAGHELGPDGLRLARTLSDETDGNPFFVAQILRHLAETGQIRLEGDRWTVVDPGMRLQLPDGVRSVVLQRAGRLQVDAQQLLAVASVVGREFDLDLVAEVTERSDVDALTAVEGALGAGLVVEVSGRAGRFSFAHALVEHSLYQSQSAARRQLLHRRVATALEARVARGETVGAALLAQHWLEGHDAATLSLAVARARAAAELAIDQLAPDDAVHWYAKALGLVDEGPPAAPEERAELLVGLGTAQRHAGEPDHQVTLREAAELGAAAGDARLMARAALAGFGGIWSANASVDAGQIELLESALAALGDQDPALRSRLLAALAVELYFEESAERREALSAEAVSLARRTGDDSALAFALQARDNLIRLPDRLPERGANAAELVSLASRLGDPAQQLWAAQDMAIYAHEAGEPERFYEQVAQMVHLGERTAQPFLRMIAGFMHAAALWVQGRLDDAEATALAAFERGVEAGQEARVRAYLAGALLRVRRDQGRLAELVEVLERAVAANPRITAFRPALGLVEAELGRTDHLDEFRRDADEGFAGHPHNMLWLSSMAMSAEIAGYQREVVAAAHLYDVLLPFRDQLIWSGITAYGPTARPLGLAATTLGQFAAAEGHFATACELSRRFGAPIWLARAERDWAAMLLERAEGDDQDRAEELLARVVATCADHGIPFVGPPLDGHLEEVARLP